MARRKSKKKMKKACLLTRLVVAGSINPVKWTHGLKVAKLQNNQTWLRRQTMAERIMWDKYEAAILLEAVLNVEANIESKTDAIERVSKQLRTIAKNRGFSIDDVYRNTNGISMQMAAMKATAFELESKMRSHSKVFCEIVAL